MTANGKSISVGDTIIVLFFALLGFVGSVILYYKEAAPIMVAVFLATGVASLVYRFLGGIEGATFAVGTLKVGGSIAALIGVAVVLNGYLVEAGGFHLVSEETMIGEWKWVYGAGGWEGRLHFTKDKNDRTGEFSFDGKEYKVINGMDRQLIYDLSKGKAVLIGRNQLQLESDVFDAMHNEKFHWKETAPFTLVPAFRGKLRSTTDEKYEWGMTIYKWPTAE